MIFHIVLFEPKDTLTLAERRSFAKSVVEAGSKIPSVRRINVGRRVDVRPGYERSFGETTYEYSAVLEFDTPDALVAYLNDPLHAELGRLFWQNCARTIICETLQVDPRAESAVDDLVL
jgi:hypothetical protein